MDRISPVLRDRIRTAARLRDVRHRASTIADVPLAKIPGPPAIDRQQPGRPGLAVTVTGALMALWCLGFAAVNLVFEVTGHFAGGASAPYASGLSVADWLVAGLKVAGAAVALLSVAHRPGPVRPAVVTVGVWAAFATLAVYVLGSIAEAAGMGLGLVGGADRIDARSVAYVLFFLVAAVGYGVLAISYSRRHASGRGLIILGVLGAPAVLGLLLLAVPAVLAAFGLLPAR
jgi:hypothetical protein